MPHHPPALTRIARTALSCVTVAAISWTSAAHAGSHGWSRSVHGPRGHGYTAERQVSRAPGTATASRSVQTDSGHGFNSTRTTTHADGTLNNTWTRTYDNGKTASRTTTYGTGN